MTALRVVAAVLAGRPDVGRPPWLLLGRRLRRLLVAVVVLYAVIVVAAASGRINDVGRMNGGLAFLIMLPEAVAVLLAVWRPLPAWRVVTAAWLVVPFVLERPDRWDVLLEPWQWFLWAPVLFAAAWVLPRRDTVALAVVSALAPVVLSPALAWPGGTDTVVYSVLGALVPVVVGASLGARWDARRALAEEQARTAAAQAERGALAERARIAREMHDVLAHELSLIAVRCETAPYRLPGLPPAAGAELAELAGTARRALTDLQQLLGVLRADDQQAARAPQPGLDGLTGLVEETRAAGVEVSAEIEPVPVPAGVGLSAYRIAQQALANAVRHAPGAAVRVELCPHDGALRLRVANGPGRAPGTPGAGVGLLGMRERAELHGGTLEAGPTGDGGFAVVAELPLDGEATA
ncbi:sensor histidine kinase [Geodermatophilus sp. SYSU D00815]